MLKFWLISTNSFYRDADKKKKKKVETLQHSKNLEQFQNFGFENFKNSHRKQLK